MQLATIAEVRKSLITILHILYRKFAQNIQTWSHKPFRSKQTTAKGAFRNILYRWSAFLNIFSIIRNKI